MHAKPDLRVLLKWMITRSGSVITDVILLMNKTVAIVESLAIRRLRMVEIVRAHAPELECVSSVSYTHLTLPTKA